MTGFKAASSCSGSTQRLPSCSIKSLKSFSTAGQGRTQIFGAVHASFRIDPWCNPLNWNSLKASIRGVYRYVRLLQWYFPLSLPFIRWRRGDWLYQQRTKPQGLKHLRSPSSVFVHQTEQRMKLSHLLSYKRSVSRSRASFSTSGVVLIGCCIEFKSPPALPGYGGSIMEVYKLTASSKCLNLECYVFVNINIFAWAKSRWMAAAKPPSWHLHMALFPPLQQELQDSHFQAM